MDVLIISWKAGTPSHASRKTVLMAILGDTVLHSWEVLAKILQSEEAKGIVCDIGM